MAPRPAPDTSASAPTAPPPVHQLAERWHEAADAVRGRGRAALAGVLVHATPVAAAATGLLTLEVPDDATRELLQAGSTEALEGIRSLWPGVRRLAVQVSLEDTAPRRLTHESVLAERTERLKRSHPVLGAAVEVLDLELLD